MNYDTKRNDIAIYTDSIDDYKTLERLSNFCKKNDYDTYTLYIDKTSDKSDIVNRPSLLKLKEKIAKKEIKLLILDSNRGISNNISFNTKFLDFAIENGCKIKNTEGYDLAFLREMGKMMEENYKEQLIRNKNKQKEEDLER